MRVGDVFKPADVHSIGELRAARRAAVVRDTTMRGERRCETPTTTTMIMIPRIKKGNAEPDDDLEPPVVREPDE